MLANVWDFEGDSQRGYHTEMSLMSHLAEKNCHNILSQVTVNFIANFKKPRYLGSCIVLNRILSYVITPMAVANTQGYVCFKQISIRTKTTPKI